MNPRFLALATLILFARIGFSEPKEPARLDANGVPLPDGAVARLGKPRPEERGPPALSPDIYETATGKFLFSVRDLPRAERAELPDEGETLVVYPIRPTKVERTITLPFYVINTEDGKNRWTGDYRFNPIWAIREKTVPTPHRDASK